MSAERSGGCLRSGGRDKPFSWQSAFNGESTGHNSNLFHHQPENSRVLHDKNFRVCSGTSPRHRSDQAFELIFAQNAALGAETVGSVAIQVFKQHLAIRIPTNLSLDQLNGLDLVLSSVVSEEVFGQFASNEDPNCLGKPFPKFNVACFGKVQAVLAPESG